MVSGTNHRELRGKLIASMKNAVKRISERTYRVSSQNGNGKYYDVRLNEENEWRCTCADFSYRSERDQDKVTGCKHIFAVEFSKKLREQVEKELVVIEPVIEIKASDYEAFPYLFILQPKVYKFMSTGDLTESILAIVIYLTTTTKDAPRTEAVLEARFDKSKFDKVEEWQDEIYFSGGYNRTSAYWLPLRLRVTNIPL